MVAQVSYTHDDGNAAGDSKENETEIERHHVNIQLKAQEKVPLGCFCERAKSPMAFPQTTPIKSDIYRIF